MKTYTTLQILEAGETVKAILRAEGFSPDYLTVAECVLDDLAEVLAGRLVLNVFELEPLPSLVLVPHVGFCEVGEVDR